MPKLMAATLVAFTALTLSKAWATTITESASIPLTTTDWLASNSNDPSGDPPDFPALSFAKFNTALGTLTSVMVQLTGDVTGQVQLENMDTSRSHTVTGNLSAQIEVDGPAAIGPIVVVVPLASQSFTLGKYDGTLNYGGTSGVTAANLSANQSKTGAIQAQDFSYFEGPGSVSLDVAATGVSTATGSGNVSSQFATNADAAVLVTYTYTIADPPAPVSEPPALPLLGAGVLGLAGIVRRRSGPLMAAPPEAAYPPRGPAGE